MQPQWALWENSWLSFLAKEALSHARRIPRWWAISLGGYMLCDLLSPLYPSHHFTFFRRWKIKVFTATHRLVPLPVYPSRGASQARGCLPPPHGLPETSGMWAALQSMCISCHSAWESKAGRSPRGTQMPHWCLHHLIPETTSICAATPWCGDHGCFSMVWNNESCCSCESLKFPPGTLAKWFHLCFPVLPSTVPIHAAEVHFWSHTFMWAFSVCLELQV